MRVETVPLFETLERITLEQITLEQITLEQITLEQIYVRAFRSIKPRTVLPRITVCFRKYANANSHVRLQDGDLRVDISDVFEHAPPAVHEALAFILLSKLFRKLPEVARVAQYRRYLNRPEVRRRLSCVKQERGRKAFRHPRGNTYDLCEIFEELNFKYFDGLMCRPELGWSLRASRTTLGHYDPSHHLIVLTSLLDSKAAPELAVKFIMFHEMLHLRFPAEYRGMRQCIHTPAFKAAERRFEDYRAAKAALKQFLAGARARPPVSPK